MFQYRFVVWTMSGVFQILQVLEQIVEVLKVLPEQIASQLRRLRSARAVCGVFQYLLSGSRLATCQCRKSWSQVR